MRSIRSVIEALRKHKKKNVNQSSSSSSEGGTSLSCVGARRGLRLKRVGLPCPTPCCHQTRSGQLPHRSRRRRSTACSLFSCNCSSWIWAMQSPSSRSSGTNLRAAIRRAASLPKRFPSAIETPLLRACATIRAGLFL